MVTVQTEMEWVNPYKNPSRWYSKALLWILLWTYAYSCCTAEQMTHFDVIQSEKKSKQALQQTLIKRIFSPSNVTEFLLLIS